MSHWSRGITRQFAWTALLAAAAIFMLTWAVHAAPALELPIGDSIAVGIASAANVAAYDAKVSASPKDVVEMIGRTPLADLHGRVVVLSTGLSNDPTALEYVPVQLAMLKAAGAKVIVLGIGLNLPTSKDINQYLMDQADANGFPYLDGWPEVHPKDYDQALANVRFIECDIYKICGA